MVYVTGQVKCETMVKYMRMSGQINAILHIGNEYRIFDLAIVKQRSPWATQIFRLS